MAIFNWVISAPISLTHEPVVTAGWEISRDFVNIFFVIALVIIALATILRIESFQAQKLLPKLIIAAILVNFTPVICGLILDIANVIMNVFRTPVLDGGNLFVSHNATINAIISAQSETNSIWSGITAFVDNLVDPKASIGLIGLLISGIFFNTILFIALSAYALIFFFRIAVIWILVILSPFALVGYFFPMFKKVFGQWWQQFFQWSIIGIPLFFFLYIAEMMMFKISSGQDLMMCSGALTVGGGLSDKISGQFLCSLLSSFFPSLFLILGVFLSFQTGAMGANMVTGGISKWAKTAGTNFGKGVKHFASSQTTGRFASTEGGKKFMRNLENIGIAKDPTSKQYKTWSTMTSSEKARAARFAPIRWAMRPVATAGLKYSAGQSKNISDRVSQFEKDYGKDYKSAAASYYNLSPADYEGKIALGQYLAKTKGGIALGGLSKAQIKDLVSTTSKYSPKQLEDIVKYYPEAIIDLKVQNSLVSDPTNDKDVANIKSVFGMGNTAPENARAKALATYKKAVDALKNDDAAAISDDIINDDDYMDMIILSRSPNFIKNIADEKGSAFTARLNQRISILGPDKIAQLNKNIISNVHNPGWNWILSGTNKTDFINWINAHP